MATPDSSAMARRVATIPGRESIRVMSRSKPDDEPGSWRSVGPWLRTVAVTPAACDVTLGVDGPMRAPRP